MGISSIHVRSIPTTRHTKVTTAAMLGAAISAAILPTAALADVTIGVLIPTSGRASGYGQQMQVAINMFSEKYLDLGKAGKLKLDILDTRGEVPEAINLTRKLIGSDAVAIVGPQLSAEVEVVFPLGVRGQMPIISAMSAKPGLASANQPWSFRYALVSEHDYAPLLDVWLKQNSGIKKVVVLYDAKDAVSAFDGVTVFPDLLKPRGVEVIEKISFQGGDIDFSAQVTRARGLGADGIVLSAFYNDAAQVAKELRKQGMKQPIVANVGVNHPRFVESGGAAVEGVMTASDFHADNPEPAVAAWVAEFKKRFKEEPGNGAALMYDTLVLTQDCIVRQGITGANVAADRVKMRDCWLNMKDREAPLMGKTSIDKGEAVRLPVILQVKGDKFTIVK